MPTYRVTDSVTGKTLKLTGDSAPTEQELVDIFKSYTPNKKRDFITPAKQTAETVAALVTGGTSWIPAGLSMGLPTIEKHGISFIPRSMEELEKRSERALKIQEKLTYQPKDKAAQRAVEIIAKPITYLPEKGKEKAEHFRKLGDEAYENGDIKTAKMYWALGGVTEFAGEASPFLIPAGVGKGVKGIKTKVNKFKAQFEEPLGLTKRTAVEQVPEAKTSAVIPEETKTKSPELKTQEKVTESKLSQEPSGVESEVDKTKEIKPSTPEDPLVAEARKYKTAEEFIAAQGEMQYHGSPVTFKEFKVENGRQFFTDNAEFAKEFSERAAKFYGEGANPSVTEAILDIQKPYIIDAKGDFAGNYQFGKKAEGYLKALKDDNYDSVIIKNTKDEGTVTIVKSKDQIKTKADLTSIWNKAQESKKTTPEERALIAEARKYKTVEEFIAAQGQTLFRASSKPFDIKLMQDDGIFLTPNKKYAEDWQKYQGYKNLEEFVIAPNAKILTQKDFPKKFIKEEGGYTFTSLDDQAAIIKYAKEKGFDGIEDYASKAGERTSHEFAIWNKDVIKTKAQLTDIWNKSNKPSKPVKPPAISSLGTQGFYEKVGKVVADIRKKITIPENLRGSMKTSLDSMIEHHRSIRHSEFLSKELTKAVNDVVKDPERQFLMTQAYEHQMKGKYWEQLNPTEKELVNYLSKEKAKLDQFIKDNDILEMKEMPQGVNHIFHHWIDPKTGKPFKATYGKFTKGLPQARQRTHMTFEEGMKNGLKPATVNLGELIGLEWEAAVRANSARELFKTLHGVKGDPDMTIVLRTGKPAKPIRMIERWDMLQKQGLSEDYVRYSSPFLDKALSFKNADGEIIVMKGAVGIQKELYPFVKAYIETPNYGNLSQLNFVSKSMKLGISMFHVVSLGMQELANFRMPFKNIPKGLRLKKDLTPELKILHQEGLELFKGYEDLGYRNQFFEGKTVVGKTGNIITYPVQKMRDFIFDVVQPGMKASFADMQFRKLLPRYLKDAKETMTAEEVMRRVKNNEPIPEAAKQCAREVVQKADGHFSGEDYKRSLLETNKWMVNAYFTPKARKFWQALLLSPTWQREHLLVAKNVAKSFMPNSMIKRLGMSEMGAIKSQYRKYALGGIMIVGAVDLWNQMSTFAMDGERKHIWENPEGKGFAVRAWWDEPDYVIENEDGSERVVKGGAAYFRPLKSLFEVAEMAHDPITKFSYKISPVVSAIGEQFWHAPWKYKEGWGDIPERLKDFALTTTAPIIATQAVPVFKGQKHPMGAIMPSFGFPTSKVKADYKDEATVETKSIKNEFNKLRSAYFKTKDVKDYNAMVEFANTQEPKVRKQLEEKYKQEVILKDSPDRAFWKSAISARPKIVGKMMFDKMKKLPPEKQQEFNAMAHRLGLDTPKAIEEYNRLATEYMAKMQ